MFATIASPMAASPVAASPVAAPEKKEKRFFDLLEPASQERIVLLKTKYNTLLPLERNAFLQELGLVSTRDVDEEQARLEQQGKLAFYNSSRLAAVRSRDSGYVTLQQQLEVPESQRKRLSMLSAVSTVSLGEPGAYAKASSDASIRRLITPALFGDGEVPIRVEKASLYEKIKKTAEITEEAEEEDPPGKKPEAPGRPGEYTYRSNAYQTLRLAHSFPHHVNMTPGTRDDSETGGMINATGMPLYEEELRLCFDQLDGEGTGALDVEQFGQFLGSLEREFGVTKEYEMLEREGHRLASGDKLSFEAFAYLMLRFVRA